MQLKGSTFIVTGGASGLGEGTVKMLAEAGANVVIADLQADKGEAIARQLEKEFSLRPNRSSRDSMERAPTQGEWKQHERTGKLSRPLRLQALVNSALERDVAFTEFQERLNRRGVALRLLVNDEGKVMGSVYEFEGKHIRGRRLGRGYTWPGLQRNWPDQQEREG